MTDRPNLPKEPLLIASYEKLDGTQCLAPYVDVSVSALTGSKQAEDVVFKARLDTGADATLIPYEYVRHFQPLPQAKPRLFRLSGGKIKRCSMYMLMVSIHGDQDIRTFRLTEGVLLNDSPIGLIGMDILRYLDVRFHNETVCVYDPSGGAA